MREDWVLVRFGDVLSYEQPGKYIVDSTDYSDEYSTPVLTAGKSFIKGFTNETDGVFRDVPVIIFDDFTTASRYVDFNFKVKSSAMKILRPAVNWIDLKFVAYAMKVYRMRSDTHKRYWISIYAKREFSLPPLPEQRAIVAKLEGLFSELDNGIAELKRAQEKLKVYRQSVLKKAFEGELTKEWRAKQADLPTGEELLDQIKEERARYYAEQLEEWKAAVKDWESAGKPGKKPRKPAASSPVREMDDDALRALTAIPESWIWIPNDQLMFYVTSGSRDWKRYYSEAGGAYFVRTQDIKTNSLEISKSAFVDLPDDVEGKRSLIERGDMLMTITGANVGKVALVDFDIPEAYVSQSVALMKYVEKKMGRYLHYYFQSNSHGAKFVGAMVYGVGRPVLSLEDMREAPVTICSLTEQLEIVRILDDVMSEIRDMQEQISLGLERTEVLRQSILKKAFEGGLLSEVELETCREAPDWCTVSELLPDNNLT